MRDGASCFRHKLLSPSCHSTMAKIRTELESNLYLKKIPRKCSINVCPHLHHPYRKFFQESSIVASRYKKIELKVQISRMEVKCASIWNEESEMIAHLQSMFWNSSDADASLSSPNSSTSSCIEPSTLPTALFLPLIQRDSYDKVPLRNTATDWCLDHQSQAFAGDKRALLIDESRKKSTNSNKKARNVSPVLSTLSSNALDDESNAELINHSSSWCCISEDDSIGVYESAVLKQSNSSRGRSRSSKNSQSVYAKKRRERINEKLKTLQQLIPNGTKVDISTMLEEAVQYVKFLQLQIKLLSSDETWMYAPLAYNHMSIDSNLNHSEKQ